MPPAQATTRERILSAATKLFYGEGIRAVSVDAVAAKAGVTKRTLYYHFTSKDELVAAYLAARDQPNLALFKGWFAETGGGPAAKVRGIFDQLGRSARHPKWKGCGFLRTSAELANMPGHPAIKIGAAHKKRFEDWLRGELEAAGLGDGSQLAHRSPCCWMVPLLPFSCTATLRTMEAAGAAAESLIDAALQRSTARSRRASRHNRNSP
jgi:AcrR family transcriptional regulator